MTAALRILLVEDSDDDARLVIRALRRTWPELVFHRVDDAIGMRAALVADPWDVVLCDWSMPGFGALRALELVNERGLDLPFILVSGTIGEEAAVAVMRAGAHDYVLKQNLTRLAPAIEREIRDSHARAARRRSEEALQLAQKMEAVGRLASGVAHDFNNMLSVVLSYCQMIHESLPGGDPLKEDVEEIAKAGRRAADLTRQLLMFSRPQVVESKVFDLNALIESTSRIVRRLLSEDIELAIMPSAALGRVKADRASLEHVLVNLVVNARDAMPTGGMLTIITENVTLDEAYAEAHVGATVGPHIVLSVTDTGIGMDAETRARLFEPFFTTKSAEKGTGLGLFTAFGIVRRAGGIIDVESAPGKGASFKVCLPLSEAAVTPEAVVSPPTVARGTETILLVEDEAQLRKVALTILERFGYRVLQASSGSEALTLAARHADRIDLLLSDVVMPRMSGPDLAHELARVRPDMRVLCMSGYTDDTIVRHGVIEAKIPFLPKPFTPGGLASKVREVLDHAAA